MDVGELLAYKPETGIKHSLDDEAAEDPKKKGLGKISDGGRARKKSRLTGLSQSVKSVPQSPRNSVPPTPPRNLPPPTPMRSRRHPSTPLPPVPSRDRAPDRQRSSHQQQEAMDQSGNASAGPLDAEEQDDGSVDDGPMDEAKVKKLVLNFDKCMLKNQELRIKFPDDPRKFLESEVNLHDAVEELHGLSVVPALYPLLPGLSLPQSLMALLGHENTDMATAVLDLLHEMTTAEGDNSDDELDGLEALVDALLGEEVVSTLVHNLQRLDDVAGPLTSTPTTEAQAVHNTLGIFENLVENRPSICTVAGPSGLLSWLLKRLRAKVIFEPNKLYASEILAICVQSSDTNRQLVGEMDGIDVLLQQLAVYKRHDPSTPEEQELMENLFDVLCSCLLLTGNRDRFLRGEGLQLMNLMLREKKLSRNGAIRVLDHTLTGPEGTDCCNKFVDILGLRTIFPLFMKTPSKHGKRGLTSQEHEGHVLSIIHWLLRNCRSAQRQRLLTKFHENDLEKVDRLMELHFTYLDRVMATDRIIEKAQQKQKETLSDDEVYLRRLDGGLFTLQLVDYIMLCVCAHCPPAIKRRVVKILNLRNASVKTIKNIIREYVSNLGDGDATGAEEEALSEEQNKVLDWLDKFQNM